MMEKGLSNKIYYATFVFALFVVLLHSSYVEVLDPNWAGYEFSFVFQRIFLVMGDAAVPAFFAISGFLLFVDFQLKDYPKMLLKKLFSIVIPYFVWAVLAFLLMQIFLPLLSGQAIELSFPKVLVDILLANDYPELWFIRPLAVFFICSPLLYFVFKYLKKWSIFIPVALFFVYMFFRPEYGGILLWIPLFFVGAYLAYFRIPIMNKFHPRLIGGLALGTFIGLGVLFAFLHAQYEDYAYYCYRFIAPALAWVSLDVLTSLFEKESVHDFFKTSAFIFFSHLGIVNGIKLLLQLGIVPDSNYRCALLFFLAFLLSCAIVIPFAYVMRRFARPVYRFLGGR